ncbi:MAG TPA: S8 family serine peptidase [Mucilaginibacter sp.]|nr:S8 family serine peptidase [Mucilaginibacter sp.]
MEIIHTILKVSVRTYDGSMTDKATVELVAVDDRPKKGDPIKLVFDAYSGTYDAGKLQSGSYLVKVSLKDYESQERPVTLNSGEQEELFILGKEGMPFYYRGRVRVPFEPLPNYLGVVVHKTEESRWAGSEFLKEIERKHSLKQVKTHSNYKKNELYIFEMPANIAFDTRGEIQKEILSNEHIFQCSPILQLLEKNATLLTDNLIVKFKPYITEQEIPLIAREYRLKLIRHIPYAGNAYQYATREMPSLRILEICDSLVKTGKVEYAEPDLWHTIEQDSVVPTDWLFPEQWDHPLINTPDAWQALRDINVNKTFGSPGVTVALFDTGIDAANHAFAGTLTDGSAKVYKLYDFINMAANNNDLSDGGHGTCTASAATGKANDPSSVAGVNDGTVGLAGNCKVIGIRYPSTESVFADAYIWTAGFNPNSAIAGFPAPISPGADIISNSFGFGSGPISGIMSDTFDYITNYGRNGKGVLLFFSTGNYTPKIDFTMVRPWAAYKKTMAIGATSLQTDGVTESATNYSNYGMKLDFCALSHATYNLAGHIVHNPPVNYGAWTASRVGKGNVPGRPSVQTTLNAAAAAGAGTVSVASTAGLVVGQGILIENPGTAGSEAKNITAINAATHALTLACDDIDGVNVTTSAPLFHAHTNGHSLAASSADYTNGMGGTSYATPVCAGLAALILSVNPDLSWIDVRQIIRDTAVKVDPNNADVNGRWRDVNGFVQTDPGYMGPFFSQWYGYGRINAALAVTTATTFVNNADIIIRDNLPDTGNNPSTGAFWNSPDIWVRKHDPIAEGAAALPANYTSAGPHENPGRNHNNWLYVRVKNRGTTTSNNFYIRAYIAHWPGTEFVFPDNFIPTNHPGAPIPTPMKPGTYLIGESFISSLGAGLDTIINMQWNMNLIPPETVTVSGSTVHWHPCLLVQITPQDGPVATGNHVWDSNNLGQKNISIDTTDSGPSGDFNVATIVGNLSNLNRITEIEINRGKLPKSVRLQVQVLDQRAMDYIEQYIKAKGKNAKISLGESKRNRVFVLEASEKIRIPIYRASSKLIPIIVSGIHESRPPKGKYQVTINQYDHTTVLSGSYGISLEY